MGRTAKSIFMFNLKGELVATDTVTKLEKKYKISKHLIKSALRRESIVSAKYYFSKKEDFVPPLKKNNHNPLHYKTKDYYKNKLRIEAEKAKKRLEKKLKKQNK
jgi:hypothetical protein